MKTRRVIDMTRGAHALTRGTQGGKHWARGFLRWRIDFLDIALRLSRLTTGLPDVQSAALTYPHCVNVDIDF